MKPVTTRDSSRVGLKPATARTRCSRAKPVARPKRNPLRIPSHPQSPNNGALFVFAIRPSQRIATPAPAESPVPTDVTGNRLTAPAHTETRPAPPRKARIATTSSEPRLFQRCAFGRLFAPCCSMGTVVRPVLLHNAAHGCPLQPLISRRQL